MFSCSFQDLFFVAKFSLIKATLDFVSLSMVLPCFIFCSSFDFLCWKFHGGYIMFFSFKSYYGFLKSIIVSILFSLGVLKHNILMQLSILLNFSLYNFQNFLFMLFVIMCVLKSQLWASIFFEYFVELYTSLFLQLTCVLECNIWWFKVLYEQTTLDHELKCQF